MRADGADSGDSRQPRRGACAGRRTVYSPLFSGVFREAQDVMLEDMARDTQGGLVSLAAGNRERGAAARYGARLSDSVHYRAWT